MEISRHWRLQKQRYGLVGEVCPHCDAKIFPPRDICPNCAEPAKTPFTFSGKATLYSHTTVYQPPTDYKDRGPYTNAIVTLEEGPRMTTQLTDVDRTTLANGMVGLADPEGHEVKLDESPLEAVFRIWYPDGDKGPIIYGMKFRPKLPIAK